jgi:hypothetical protein
LKKKDEWNGKSTVFLLKEADTKRRRRRIIRISFKN